jgi:hypothetical protein
MKGNMKQAYILNYLRVTEIQMGRNFIIEALNEYLKTYPGIWKVEQTMTEKEVQAFHDCGGSEWGI